MRKILQALRHALLEGGWAHVAAVHTSHTTFWGLYYLSDRELQNYFTQCFQSFLEELQASKLCLRCGQLCAGLPLHCMSPLICTGRFAGQQGC